MDVISICPQADPVCAERCPILRTELARAQAAQAEVDQMSGVLDDEELALAVAVEVAGGLDLDDPDAERDIAMSAQAVAELLAGRAADIRDQAMSAVRRIGESCIQGPFTVFGVDERRVQHEVTICRSDGLPQLDGVPQPAFRTDTWLE